MLACLDFALDKPRSPLDRSNLDILGKLLFTHGSCANPFIKVGRKIDEFQARHADLALRLRGHIARVREICGERDAAALLFSSAAAPAANSAAPNMAMLWYNVA